MLKISYDHLYNHPLKENHRFPMIKYELIPEQLIIENTCNESNFFKPGLINEENILLTHDKIYYEKLKNQELNKRINIHDGKIVYKAVADTFGYEYFENNF